MLTGIDHIAIVVDELVEAGTAFEHAGFVVTPGGSHPGGTQNALIPFVDGSYLELIAIDDQEKAADHPWFRKMAGKQGFAAFALAADPIDYEMERLASLGLVSTNHRDGARQRPDGQMVHWKSTDLETEPPIFLPFLIQDVTNRSLRIPSGKETHHPNGIQGTTGLTIVTDDLSATREVYAKLLSAPVSTLDHGFEGTIQSWRSFFGTNWVDLVQVADDNVSLSSYWSVYGAGIYQIYLTVETGSEFPVHRIDIAGIPDLHILTTN